MTDAIEAALDAASSFVWGPFFLIPLLLVVGVYLTVRLRGLQFRMLVHALWLALVRRDEKGETAEGDISHYQALSTALAATVGVGNIAGAALAIGVGGPGALFWMWVTGLLGMATKYSEALLGVKYRRPDSKGEMSGGPMFYLRHGLAERFGPGSAGARAGVVLGFLFALFGAVASFGIGNMTQANAVASQLDSTFDIPTWASGVGMVVLVGAVILGGIRSIGRFAAGAVPLMIIVYVVASLLVLAVHVADIPAALALVVTDAFTGTSMVGGFAGATFLLAMQQGMARGIFSNESGLGTGGIAAAAARTAQPVRQAMVSMTQTFIDTIIVVTMTGMVIIVTGAWNTQADTGDGSLMTNWAMSEAFGGISPALAPLGGLLRRAVHGLPVRPRRRPAVPAAVRRGRLRRRHLGAEPRLDVLRRGQRPDGGAQPDRPAGAVRHRRRRDEEVLRRARLEAARPDRGSHHGAPPRHRGPPSSPV
jgi:AGCS family alanine or glycine:cation symporter